MEIERDQAAHVKQAVPILVVIGNPPYNAFAGTSPKEELGLADVYKAGLISKWGIKKFNLDELYVRFLRIAERRISETGKGLFCYISNYSYLTDASFVVARQRLLSEFDDIWIDCLNGDSRETGKLTPDGAPDPSVFSTPYNRAGIRVGTAVGMFVRREDRQQCADVRYRDFWGVEKRKELLESLTAPDFQERYTRSDPQNWNRLSFKPLTVSPNYLSWPKVIQLAGKPPINGLMEKRAGGLIDIERNALSTRMKSYLNREVSWESYRLAHRALTIPAAGFEPAVARKKMQNEESYSDDLVVRYLVRPFDARYAYYSAVPTIWNRARPQLWDQQKEGAEFLITRPGGVARPEGAPFMFSRMLGDNDAQRGHSYYFPVQWHEPQHGIIAATVSPNLSEPTKEYLKEIGAGDPDTDGASASAPWYHVLAIGYFSLYLTENTDGVAIDWPRIPLPKAKSTFIKSVGLGRRLSTLLDMDIAVSGVTSGAINPAIMTVGTISATNLAVTAGWGRMDTLGKVFPGNETVTVREWTATEVDHITRGCDDLGFVPSRAFELLGKPVDVYINDTTRWIGVPNAVWQYHIGGYQVLKKWLSYRDNRSLVAL